MTELDTVKQNLLNGLDLTSDMLSRQKKQQSDEASLDGSTKTSENDDIRDDDDDDDNDDVDVKEGADPERLKAFNMFVRLFVDENLDRSVPISKQPKEKIQAILDACDRQFPEFHSRSRKRVRTYLKSCRRLKRSRDTMATWEHPFRTAPPHLTSAVAEGILAKACENESQNAKRMRMGLEPLSSTSPLTSKSEKLSPTTTAAKQPSAAPTTSKKSTNNGSSSTVDKKPESSSTSLLGGTTSSNSTFTDLFRFPPPPPLHPTADLHSSLFVNGLFRPSFPPNAFSFQPPSLFPQFGAASMLGTTGDRNDMTKSRESRLSTTEVSSLRQMVAAYRESASFLYRSADELEQMLLRDEQMKTAKS